MNLKFPHLAAVQLDILPASPIMLWMMAWCFCLCLSGCVTTDTPGPFQKMANGDAIHVTYQSIGCFHFTNHELRFVKDGKVTVNVVDHEQRWNDELKKREQLPEKNLGTLTLSKSDLARLDRLIEFYRSKPGLGCTTIDTVEMVQLRQGQPDLPERFEDGSCATDDMKHVLTLRSLIQRLEKQSNLSP